MAKEKQGHVKYIRVRQADGSFTDAMLIAVSPYNVDFEDGTNLVEKLEEKAEKRYYGDTSINVGRIPGTDTGANSIAVGENVTAKGNQSVSLGINTSAENEAATALGKDTKAVGKYSVAQGESTYAGGYASVAEGYQSSATGKYSHAQGEAALATGEDSFASGYNTVANGKKATALGEGTIATGNNSLVHGRYNIEDTENKYAEIIGNGLDDENRSNAYTLDWQGNATFSGNISADTFEGKVSLDSNGNKITEYIKDITVNQKTLTLRRGDGTTKEVNIAGFSEKNTQYYSWTNEDPGTINGTEKMICELAYGGQTLDTDKPGAIFMAQLLVNASPLGETLDVSFNLKIDGIKVNEKWTPTEQLPKGPHIITLMYPLEELDIKNYHKFQLSAFCAKENDILNYEAGDIKCILYGVGFPGGGEGPVQEIDETYFWDFQLINLPDVKNFCDTSGIGNIFFDIRYNYCSLTDKYMRAPFNPPLDSEDQYVYNNVISYNGKHAYYSMLYSEDVGKYKKIQFNIFSNTMNYYFNKNSAYMFASYNPSIYSVDRVVNLNSVFHNLKSDSFKYVENLTETFSLKDVHSSTYASVPEYTFVANCDYFDFNNVKIMDGAFNNVKLMDGDKHCASKISNVISMINTYKDCFNLLGPPIIGTKVVNAYGTFQECHSLIGTPVCHDSIKNFSYTYYNCHNITGEPMIGSNIIDASYAYCNCDNLTGKFKIPPIAKNIHGMYEGCNNLTILPDYSPISVIDMSYTFSKCIGIIKNTMPISNSFVKNMKYTYNNTKVGPKAVFGPNVEDVTGCYRSCSYITQVELNEANLINIINMNDAYGLCTNLKSRPICGPNVQSFSYTYQSCHNLTGSPVCGPNVIDMIHTYEYCNNLTGSPVCGPNVIYMEGTYEYCHNLTGSPVCGPNVIYMNDTYRGCNNLTGSAACGPKVISMGNTYSYCNNLTKAVCGPNVIYMNNTYSYCNRLIEAVCGDNVERMNNTYAYCRSLKTPVCGNNVIDMMYTYAGCEKLNQYVCGPNVIFMAGTYKAAGAFANARQINVKYDYPYYEEMRVENDNIFGYHPQPVCGPEVINMYEAYRDIDYKLKRFKHELYYGPGVRDFRNVIAPLYGDDGIIYYSSILGDIPAPVIGNNAYRLRYAYLHYGDTYVNINGQFYQGYTGDTYIRFNQLLDHNKAIVDIDQVFGLRTRELSLPKPPGGVSVRMFNIFLAENSDMNCAFYEQGKNIYAPYQGIPFGEVLIWDQHDTINNFYYNSSKNVRIYYYNTQELSHTYKVQDPIVKEADCTNAGYICKEYIDEEQTETDKGRTIILPALGHDFDEDGVCRRCGISMRNNWVEQPEIGTHRKSFIKTDDIETWDIPYIDTDEYKGYDSRDTWVIDLDRDIEDYEITLDLSSGNLITANYLLELDGERLCGVPENNTQSQVIFKDEYETFSGNGIHVPYIYKTRLKKGQHKLVAVYNCSASSQPFPHLLLTLPKIKTNGELIEKIGIEEATCLTPEYEIWSVSDETTTKLEIANALGHDYDDNEKCRRCGYQKIGWKYTGSEWYHNQGEYVPTEGPIPYSKSITEEDTWVVDFVNTSSGLVMAKWEIDVPPEQAEEEYDIDYFIKDGQQGLLSLKFDDNEIINSSNSYRKGHRLINLTEGKHKIKTYISRSDSINTLELKFPDLNRKFTRVEVISEPTCTEEGLINYYYLKNGAEVLIEAHKPALGHDIDGSTHICRRCGEYIPTSIEIVSQGDYTFIPSGINNTIWTSNNYNINNSNATITLKTLGYSAINWRVSSENGCDKLTITVDETTMVNQSSGINNGTITLDSSEEHIIQATYSKDGSTYRNEDIGELIFIE